MINAAKIDNNRVVNILLVTESVKREFELAGVELIDADPLGLSIGDYREGEDWFRGEGEDRIQLTAAPEEDIPSYAELLAFYKASHANKPARKASKKEVTQ